MPLRSSYVRYFEGSIKEKNLCVEKADIRAVDVDLD